MTWDPDIMPAKCANGDGNPIAGDVVVDVVGVAVDEDGYCWTHELLCHDCLTKETA